MQGNIFLFPITMDSNLLPLKFAVNFQRSRIRPQDLTLTFIKELTAVVLEKGSEMHYEKHKQHYVKRFPNS